MRSWRVGQTRFVINSDISRAAAGDAHYEPLYVRVVGPERPEEREPTAEDLRARAVRGDVEAQIGWAHKLLDGRDVPRDLAAAYRWFSIAAGHGNADALNMVGRCHENGWHVGADTREAARWYRQAADKGHAWGAFNLGCLLAQGRGVAADPKAALSYLVQAARGGNAKAMNMIGRYREQTSGGANPARSAALWFRWAAERGCFRGQFHHGRRLAEAGRIEEGKAWILRSLADAPEDYRSEALAVLRDHPLPALRDLSLAHAPADGGRDAEHAP